MTAALRHTLHLISPADSLAETSEQADTFLAESVVEQWQPEHQFIGALLYLSVDEARPLLDLVPDAAIAKPVAAGPTS